MLHLPPSHPSPQCAAKPLSPPPSTQYPVPTPHTCLNPICLRIHRHHYSINSETFHQVVYNARLAQSVERETLSHHVLTDSIIQYISRLWVRPPRRAIRSFFLSFFGLIHQSIGASILQISCDWKDIITKL